MPSGAFVEVVVLRYGRGRDDLESSTRAREVSRSEEAVDTVPSETIGRSHRDETRGFLVLLDETETMHHSDQLDVPSLSLDIHHLRYRSQPHQQSMGHREASIEWDAPTMESRSAKSDNFNHHRPQLWPNVR